MLSAAIAEFDLGAHCGEKLARGFNVAHLRDVFENNRLFRKQCGSHCRQGCILGTADADGAQQGSATSNDELIHRKCYESKFIVTSKQTPARQHDMTESLL